jgi:hypothetical protein
MPYILYLLSDEAGVDQNTLKVEDFISFNPREINIGNVNDIVKTVLD